ncbi:hypothetical protein A3K73_04805 [Candidatus Pacearchaeota archaeon RBG_13_36_9]|nr:MAG: hypothetical protein A3K73_04805 [Candidatus Pacearchaeota archaeon RBG_13_36_9]
MKQFFKSESGEIHFGDLAEPGFLAAKIENIDSILENLGAKKLWRCTVCNDLHIGEKPPKICPTCFAEEAYVEINKKEFLEMVK